MFKIRDYDVDPSLYYDPKEHLWIKVDGNTARIGIEPLEQETKGAFVVVQLNKAGAAVSKGDSFGSLEAEKHVGMLRSPISGNITAANQAVLANPRLANVDPLNSGWFIEIEMSDFETEKTNLITGEEALREWYAAEIKRYEDSGWLAESQQK